ncbi:MAG: hypothetical protein KDB04_13685 [Acidimicrobiales bacterium]|nr:hypothetical protein [Acidimicrobiales bacterium]HRW39567.1 hypothetical protein [Aquihabitans sp.]
MNVVVTIARWLGRALVLGAVYVLACAFFFPQGVQFLNPLVCADTLELDNAAYRPPPEPDNERLQLVCTSPEATESAAAKVFLVAAGSAAAGFALVYVAQRRSQVRAHIPGGPTIR